MSIYNVQQFTREKIFIDKSQPRCTDIKPRPYTTCAVRATYTYASSPIMHPLPHPPVITINFACRSPLAQFANFAFAISTTRRTVHVSADTRGVASRRGIFSTTEPTDDHAVCIFPFRRYEVCGMILYAKSSLELIVNNRIGKVGIRPDGRPPSAPHHQRHHPPLYPRTTR